MSLPIFPSLGELHYFSYNFLPLPLGHWIQNLWTLLHSIYFFFFKTGILSWKKSIRKMKMNEWYFPLKHLNHLLIIIFDPTIDISMCSSGVSICKSSFDLFTTLTQHGDINFRTFIVFLFSNFNYLPFLFRKKQFQPLCKLR